MKASARTLSILIVEARDPDARLVVARLEHAGYQVNWTRVETEGQYVTALGAAPDLVLSDYSLPNFNGTRALALLHERGLDIPFIMMSGTIDEEHAIEVMLHGPDDYLLKGRLGRLGRAAAAALERKNLRAAARVSEELFRATFDEAPSGIAHTSLDRAFVRVNRSLCEMLGYTREELLGMNVGDLTHPEDLHQDDDSMKRVLTGAIGSYTSAKRLVRKDGAAVWMNRTVSLVRDPNGRPAYFIRVFEDISRKRRAEDELRDSQRFAQWTMDGLSQRLCVLDETGAVLSRNTAWQNFAMANGAHVPEIGESANYRDACNEACRDSGAHAGEFAAGMRSVIRGEREAFELEYLCQLPGGPRWFTGKVTVFHDIGRRRVLVTHDDISDQVLAAARVSDLCTTLSPGARDPSVETRSVA